MMKQKSKKGAKALAAYEDHTDPHAHDEPWLISYADMMTLLFGFFVLMYTLAASESSGSWERIRLEMSKHFGGTYADRYKDIKDDIKQLFGKEQLREQIKIESTPEGLKITFRSHLLFAPGRAKFSPRVEGLINATAEVVHRKHQRQKFTLIIEGHTDDTPMRGGRFSSNWDLSSARAISMLSKFEQLNFPMKDIEVRAYGETRPVAKNRNELGEPIKDNQAKNRRVVLRLVSKLNKRKRKPASKSSN